MENENLVYYIWLALKCGAGSEAPNYLLSHFDSPKDIYEADEAAISQVIPGRKGIIAALCDKDLDTPERVLEYCRRTNVGILTQESDIYPERLRTIHARPLVLYYKGCFPNIDEHVTIGCVGTRSCTDKGAKNAYALGAGLAKAGAIVVSGMALGIDTMCARGALSQGGHTIAVLGCGIDRVYPKENKDLMAAIIENGTVITEYAPGMVPNGRHFPVRNRIISGLSLGTVVVEANIGSGALITAEHARKQGRDVFAFPGDIDNACSKGTNELIACGGAVLVRSASDVLAEYSDVWYKRIFNRNGNIIKNVRVTEEKKISRDVSVPQPSALGVDDYSAKGKNKKVRHTEDDSIERAIEEVEKRGTFEIPDESSVGATEQMEAPEGLEGIDKAVYECLNGTLTADEITVAVRKTGIEANAGAVLGSLTTLELYGYCESLPGGLFRKI